MLLACIEASVGFAQGVSGYSEQMGTLSIPGSQATGTVNCPSGDVVLDGGYYQPLTDIYISQSEPSNSSGAGWTVSVNNLTGQAVTVTMYAICAQSPGSYSVQTAACAGASSCTINCPAGTSVTGGGYSYSVPLVANGSFPSTSSQWSLTYSSTGGSISGEAVCAQAPDGYVQESGVTGQFAGLVNVPCPSGTVVVGGGGNEGPDSAQNAGWNAPIAFGPVLVNYQWSFGSGATGAPPSVSGRAICAGQQPTVSGVNPASGSVAGGTSVVITGTNLTGATAVTFGTAGAAANFTVNGPTQITATSPPGTAGPVDVTITTAGGTTATGSGDRFTYVVPPAVSTAAASGVMLTAAVLNGAVNPNGAAVSDCHFDWGTSAVYGKSVPCANSVGSGSSPIAVSATLSGLSAGTTYHFRVVATGPGGTSSGGDAAFTTAPPAPSVTTLACAPSSVFVGQATVCAVTVSSSGGGVPTGTVSLVSSGSGMFSSAGGCMLAGSALSASCSVLYTPSAVGSGTHTIAASYGGDATHGAASGSASLTVSGLTVTSTGGGSVRKSSIVVSCSPGMVAAGQSTSCVATVSDVAGGTSAPPGGTVTFMASGASGISGGGTCRLVGSGGSASCSVRYALSSSGAGTYTVSAVYGGDGIYAAGSGLTSFAVLAASGVAGAAAVVSGVVLIRDSSGAFVPLEGSTVSVPFGSVIDARKGVVRLSTAADYLSATDPRHRVQTGTFSVAIFVVKQMTERQAMARARTRHKRLRLAGIPSTDLQLVTAGEALANAGCRRTGPPGTGVVRAFSGVAKGLYRTLAANSITTVQNATWIVKDRCDGTLTEVGRGTATVTPTHGKHPQPVTLHSGQGVVIKGRFA